jgi:hypothetical protein
MKFLRHVGKHNDRKVAVVFREVPGEPHMCLVTYTELLGQNIHDPLMSCIESDIGQTSENLAEALNRNYTKDGRPILQVLHAEGQLKKVNTELIVMTPQPNTKIKLNELNKILDEMQQGEAAVKRLAEMDKSLGMQNPQDVIRRMRNNPPESTAPSTAPNNGAISDTQLAENLRQQAQKMARDAEGLKAEADRLLQEASQLDPKPIAKSGTSKPATKARKSRTKVTT